MEARLISLAGAASLSMTEIRDAAARDGGTLWLDFDHTDEDSMELLGELIDVRPSDIQECHNRSPVPKMRFYADHHFSAINGLARGADGRLRFQPLKLFLTPRVLVTVLGPTSSSLTSEIARRELTAVRQRVDSGQLRPASSFELVGRAGRLPGPRGGSSTMPTDRRWLSMRRSTTSSVPDAARVRA